MKNTASSDRKRFSKTCETIKLPDITSNSVTRRPFLQVTGTGTKETIRRWTAGNRDLAQGRQTPTVSASEELTLPLLKPKAVRLIRSRKDESTP